MKTTDEHCNRQILTVRQRTGNFATVEKPTRRIKINQNTFTDTPLFETPL